MNISYYLELHNVLMLLFIGKEGYQKLYCQLNKCRKLKTAPCKTLILEPLVVVHVVPGSSPYDVGYLGCVGCDISITVVVSNSMSPSIRFQCSCCLALPYALLLSIDLYGVTVNVLS